jgi:hypothetical protein
VATAEWIESAAHEQKPPSGGDGFVDRKAAHLLHGAFAGVPGEAAAGRLLIREAPDVAARLQLPAVPADAAAPLVGLVQRGDMAAARAWIGGLTPSELSAVRLALKRRREDR